MKRGLVIGKFMPVHTGHVALIEFAAESCDELILSMSYTHQDPIDHELRVRWLQSIFESQENIKIEKVLDDFDNEAISLEERTKVWAQFITGRYPKIDLVFSSESYGEPFARNLGAIHMLFDLERKLVPISGSEIRSKPFLYWHYIPTEVRPYYLKKICFFGAESTGKSTMAKRVAAHYNTEYVPEVAREIITSNDFSISEILKIGEAQAERVRQKALSANRILICDTDAITTQIYSSHYLKRIPEQLLRLEGQIRYDKYFLFDIDTPWVSDGLRDLGELREEMNKKFEQALVDRKIPFVEVRGTWDERFEIIRNEIDLMIK